MRTSNIVKKIKDYIQNKQYQQAYDYIDSTQLYDDIKEAGGKDLRIDTKQLHNYVIDTFIKRELAAKLADDKSIEYVKSICNQLGLDYKENPFIRFLNQINYTFKAKDIIALNNAYSRYYIDDKDLIYNNDKNSIPNILYTTSLYELNNKPSDIINIIEKSKNFKKSSDEDIEAYFNIFYKDGVDGDHKTLNNWDTIYQNIGKYKDYLHDVKNDTYLSEPIYNSIKGIKNSTSYKKLRVEDRELLDDLFDKMQHS